MKNTLLPGVIVLALVFSSCSTNRPGISRKSDHEIYGNKIKESGLGNTALGRMWFDAAQRSVMTPAQVKLPYSEVGYFAAEEPRAVGLKFTARRGEKLTIELKKKPATGMAVFLDLFQSANTNQAPKLIAAADSTNAVLQYEVRQDGMYLVRLQPELLKNAEYSVAITTGPSFAFPVSPKAKATIGSFWGANRGNGSRKHEGIDIFAARRTPLVAAADGTVTAVHEGGLGGKIVSIHPYNSDYTLYYAHLDEQLVSLGQQVKTGDMIGLVGNTGNAKTTPSHLHFGIYTYGGAIDPLPFIRKESSKPAPVSAPVSQVSQLVKAAKNITINIEGGVTSKALWVEANTLMKVLVATENKYRVALPDGQEGYIASNDIASISKPIKNVAVKTQPAILDRPAADGITKAKLKPGSTIAVVATYKDYYYVSGNNTNGWIAKSYL